KHEYLRF
uniref:FMRFamide-like neuropeptide AF2 n=2 Tax=Rhabditida TaxID=6236 RepID=FAF2_PANRE|nr:RecName: Full=FMRFamide-like neuropeptide AF2 [Ascaris suum]P67880.1 RecName: Full=FMRFamide-like neuropeptide AF2 [Panagrellus redivivus]AAB35928.1 AF2 [Caenorhabditis elegans=nematodes, Peptide, 7 aa] [Caenorhabditis elegans]